MSKTYDSVDKHMEMQAQPQPHTQTHAQTQARTTEAPKTHTNVQLGDFMGKLYSFNNSLKLYHWSVTGVGSYAKHIALDQAYESLSGILDRIAETSLAMYGDITVAIPETDTPKNIIQHAENFYHYVEDQRTLLPESFSGAIIDDYNEAVQELLYRLKRLQ